MALLNDTPGSPNWIRSIAPQLGRAVSVAAMIRPPLGSTAGPTTTPTVARWKVAVTAFALDIVTWQAPVPVQDPLHPAKWDPAVGEAVNVTCVPSAYCS